MSLIAEKADFKTVNLENISEKISTLEATKQVKKQVIYAAVVVIFEKRTNLNK